MGKIDQKIMRESKAHLSHEENDVILLLDKDIDFVTEVKGRLEKEGYHVSIALNITKGTEMFYGMKPAFVLVDAHLCDTNDSRHEFEQFIQVVYQNHTPIAVVSNEVTLENRVKAYELGATDFVDKEVIDPDWFIPYLRNRLAHHHRILVDELTGAYNRKYMDLILEEMISDYDRHGDVFSIAMIDLDFFKQVNDTYGHLVGDEVLQALVATINKHKRKSDDLCRYGGEEFQLSLPRTDSRGAVLQIERIREDFANRVFRYGDAEFRVTFSAGVTTVHPTNADKEKLLDEADKALYGSKSSGRNCTVVYSEAADITVIRRLHVIIVDDNRLIRTMLERSFKEWDFEKSVEVKVHTYADGVEFLASEWYDPNDKFVILLDGIMPRMNGTEVLGKVRQIYPDRDIVISMLSARSGEANIVQALEKGADDYMLKPFKIQEVLARVGRLARRMLF